jgi:hypothetical protein
MQNMQKTHGNRAVQRLVSGRPTGGAPAWYDFSNENEKGGFDFGTGYGVAAGETGSWWERMGGDLPFAGGSLFSWGENDNKDTRYGAKAEAGAGRVSYNGDGWSAEGSTLGANAEASAGTNGASLGAGLTGIGGSATFGKFNANSNTDTSTRFGLSAGPSFGLRGHWGDSDSDGSREVGVGFDLGIFSADLKTEDPLRTGMALMNSGGVAPLAAIGNDMLGINKMPGGQYLPSNENDKSNWTEGLLGWANGSGKPTTMDDSFNDSRKKLSNWWDS